MYEDIYQIVKDDKSILMNNLKCIFKMCAHAQFTPKLPDATHKIQDPSSTLVKAKLS